MECSFAPYAIVPGNSVGGYDLTLASPASSASDYKQRSAFLLAESRLGIGGFFLVGKPNHRAIFRTLCGCAIAIVILGALPCSSASVPI